MKVWVAISVLCLGWSAPPTLKTYLQAVDPTLPHTERTDGKICYYFDIAQTCSGEAISHLLGQATPTDIPNWTPLPADCETLLDNQRLYAETIASSLFADSITSAGIASVGDYELMVQSWVLRVGHYQLAGEHAAFRAVLNGVTSWTTVKCDGTNLLHDGATTPLPAFVGAQDCIVLSDAFPVGDPCDNPACTAAEALACLPDDTSPCLSEFIPNNCGNSGCADADAEVCCRLDCNWDCCGSSSVSTSHC